MSQIADRIGPGMMAFIFFFTLAVVLWLLMRNMNARMRRMSYAQRRAEQEQAGGGPASPRGGTAAATGAGASEESGDGRQRQ